MRLTLFTGLLVLLSAATATGQVANSKHDFSALGGLAGMGACAYCHSVHNAVGGIGRPAHLGSDLPNIEDFYTVTKIDGTTHLEQINNSDAPLCLTCHDGATFDATDMDIAVKALILHTANDITVDLRDDHPVGFDFTPYIDDLNDGIRLPDHPRVHVVFGPDRNQMWCSSCHNAHGGEPGTPLLVMSNNGSDLCFQCHEK